MQFKPSHSLNYIKIALVFAMTNVSVANAAFPTSNPPPPVSVTGNTILGFITAGLGRSHDDGEKWEPMGCVSNTPILQRACPAGTRIMAEAIPIELGQVNGGMKRWYSSVAVGYNLFNPPWNDVCVFGRINNQAPGGYDDNGGTLTAMVLCSPDAPAYGIYFATGPYP